MPEKLKDLREVVSETTLNLEGGGTFRADGRIYCEAMIKQAIKQSALQWMNARDWSNEEFLRLFFGITAEDYTHFKNGKWVSGV